MRRADSLVKQAVVLLKTLVGFDSTSRNSNLPIIECIENHLRALGAVCACVPSPDGNKSNLLARLGPEAAGGIVLSGHTDVVPVLGQVWDGNPFTVVEHGGKLYGRGTADMKSFIAVCLALAPEFLKLKLKKPIWLAFSYDEEIGCLGVPHLLEYIVKHIPKPAFAIIGEPTMMRVVTAHKGVLSFKTTVHGLEAHSSQPQLGVNAVHIACELVHFLNVLAAELAASGTHDERFQPPYSTIHAGTIEGGTARNIIARECSFQWEIRPLPGDDVDALIRRFDARCKELRAEMKKISAETDIVTQPMSRMTGVTLPPAAHRHCQTVMRCAQTNREFAVSFGTEAGVFNDHGIPAVICGPGSIEQAHRPNEFIELAQIDACVEFMLRLAAQLTVNG
ncbi:MAG: acetylornithine deacetylase [Pseudomonadota bacterium]|nr:acetylornithine deacetylase [Pseudomonadota bacterium]MDE3038621.1 acetylornithine deacetylase [Pseudomonadota bacterium]